MNYESKFELFNPKKIVEILDWVKINYRPYDPANYLYRKILEINDLNDKFSDEYIELIYTTLSAWNMNSRGAKLANIDVFKKTFQKNKPLILALNGLKLGELDKNEFHKILDLQKKLYFELELVAEGKPRLVTFSKAMHFMIPELFIPIDRTYTLVFFYGHTNLPKDLDGQFRKYSEIYEACYYFASMHRNLKNNDKDTLTKILDNLIIGEVSLRKNDKSTRTSNS